MTTEDDRELAQALREAERLFLEAHDISLATLLDMYLGTVAGSAIRFGEGREAFATRVLDAYDTLTSVIDPPTGIFGLLHRDDDRGAESAHLMADQTEKRIVFTLGAARAVVVPWRVRKGDGPWEVTATADDGVDYVVCECQDQGLAEFIAGHHNDRHSQQKGLEE